MKLRTLALALALLIATLALPLHTAGQEPAPVVHRVDPADPTGPQTIQSAIDASGPRDIIEIATGIYAESVTIPHDLVIRAAPGANVTITDTLAGDFAAGITVTGGNVTIEDLRIDYRNKGRAIMGTVFGWNGDVRITGVTAWGREQSMQSMSTIELRHARNIWLQGVEVHSGVNEAISVDGTGDVTVRDSKAFSRGITILGHNATAVNNRLSGGWADLEALATSRVVVENNTISNTSYGIYAEGVVLRVRHNIVENIVGGGDGIYTFLPFQRGATALGDHRIENNSLTDISGWPLIADTDWDIEREGDLIIANNTILRGGDWAIQVFWDGDLWAVDNTISDLAEGSYGFYADCGAGGLGAVHVERNIVRNAPGGIMIANEGPYCAPGGPYVMAHNRVEDVQYDALSGGVKGGAFIIRENSVVGVSDRGGFSAENAVLVWEADALQFIGNHLEDVHSAGAWLEASGTVTVEDNTFLGVLGNPGPVGIGQVGLEISAGGPVAMINNTITGFASDGVVLESDGLTSLLSRNRIDASGTRGLSVSSTAGTFSITGNNVTTPETASAVHLRLGSDLGAVALQDNVLAGGVGIVIEVVGESFPVAEFPFRFNDLSRTTVPFASCSSAAFEAAYADVAQVACWSGIGLAGGLAPLNYYGPHGPPPGLAAYAPVGVEPFLTAPPDPLRQSDDVQTFGFHVHAGGGPFAVGAPGPMARSLHEMFDPGFEGIYYAFNETSQTWVQTFGDEVLGALEARVVVPVNAARILYDFADEPVQDGARSIPAGWSFQAPRQHATLERAFDGGAGAVAEAADLFSQPVQQADHHGAHYGPRMHEVWEPGPPVRVDAVRPCSGPLASPFGGYFTRWDEGATVTAAVPPGVRVSEWWDLLIDNGCLEGAA